VLQRFGREALLQEVLDDLGQEVYREALENEDLEPYDVGSLEDVQLDPLVFKMRVPLMPEVDLGDYRELRAEPPAVTVDEERVNAQLEQLREAHAILEPAGDRPAELGDMVSVEVSSDQDEGFPIADDTYDVLLDAEDSRFAPGFSEQIVGLSAGEEKQFPLTLPEELGEDWAGKEATFDVTLLDVRSRTLPELDDDLARTVGDFDTMEELELDIRRQFEEEAQREADAEYAEKVLEELVAGSTLEYPPDVVEAQIDNMVEDMERRLESQGLPMEEYLKLSGQTEEAVRESVHPQAERIVRRGLTLGELARQEKLDVEGEEIDQRIALLSAGWGERADEVQQMLSSPESVRSITSDLLTSKAVQRLVAIAKGEAPSLEQEPASDEDLPGDAEVAQDEAEEVPSAEAVTEGVDTIEAAESIAEVAESIAEVAESIAEVAESAAEADEAEAVDAESSAPVSESEKTLSAEDVAVEPVASEADQA
jgi:trigger factor